MVVATGGGGAVAALLGADEGLQEVEVSGVVGPEDFAAARRLQPEREVEVPIDGRAEGDDAGWVGVCVGGSEDAGAGWLPELRQAAVGAGEGDTRLRPRTRAAIKHQGALGAARADHMKLVAEVGDREGRVGQ